MRYARAVLLVTAALFVVSSAGVSAKDAPQVLRYCHYSAPHSLNPHNMMGQVEMRFGEALFEGLTYMDPATCRPVPGAAESWSVSEDGRRYTFTMRKEARWSDGQRVTSEDFVRAFQRFLAPISPCEWAYLYEDIAGARALHTFGAYARRILGPVSKVERTLVAEVQSFRRLHPNGAPRRVWRRLAFRGRFPEIVGASESEVLRRSIEPSEADLSATDLDQIEKALREAASRFQTLHEEAKTRFGKDLGVYAKGPDTLVIDLDVPHPRFLDILAMATAAPIHPDAPKGWDDEWFRPSIPVNGPFRLAAVRKDGSMRIEKNETYWGAKSIQLEAVEALSIESPDDALKAFRAGTIDVLYNLPRGKHATLRTDPAYRSVAANVVYYYVLNCTNEALRDVRVRRALSLALDRKAIVDHLGGDQRPAYRFVPPGMRGYKPPSVASGFDPAQARTLLADAGYANGKGLTFGLLFNTSQTHKALAQIAASSWKTHLGVEVRPFHAEWQMYLTRRFALEYDIARWGWIGDYSDPMAFLELWSTGDGTNSSGWVNSEYRTLVAKAKSEHDAVKRPALLANAEALLLSEMPAIPVYYYAVGVMVAPHVRGLYTELETKAHDGTPLPNAMDWHPLRGMSIER